MFTITHKMLQLDVENKFIDSFSLQSHVNF